MRGIVHSVRERAGSSPDINMGPAVRAVIRIDVYQHLQRIDWSIVAWQHPAAIVVLNDLFAGTGFLLADVIEADIASAVAAMIDNAMDPFPESALAPRNGSASGASGNLPGEL